MSDKRVPTEAEWRLVAEAVPSCRFGLLGHRDSFPVYRYVEEQKLWVRFDPLHDHNDLARLVEAMQAAGWVIVRRHQKTGRTCCDTFRHIGTSPVLQRCGLSVDADTDREATYWACIEALKEKRDADTDG